jgi:hypothetical protein
VELKATITVAPAYHVEVNGVSLGTFVKGESWNGLLELRQGMNKMIVGDEDIVSQMFSAVGIGPPLPRVANIISISTPLLDKCVEPKKEMSERTRVVVMLYGGEYISTYHPTEKAAKAYIGEWVAGCKKRIEAGEVGSIDTRLLTGGVPGEPEDELCWAALAQYIIGMYIPDNRPSAGERVAAVLEKQISDGEDWKN